MAASKSMSLAHRERMAPFISRTSGPSTRVLNQQLVLVAHVLRKSEQGIKATSRPRCGQMGDVMQAPAWVEQR